jgi:hypothetical protein
MKKIILFIFMFLMFNTCVYASSHLDLVPIDGIYSSQFNLSTGGYFSSNQKKYFMDGKIVYCIEPGTPIYTNEFYGVGDLSLSGIEQKTIDLISLIGYFGYDYPGHQLRQLIYQVPVVRYGQRRRVFHQGQGPGRKDRPSRRHNNAPPRRQRLLQQKSSNPRPRPGHETGDGCSGRS